jgi:HEAT repeat protein
MQTSIIPNGSNVLPEPLAAPAENEPPLSRFVVRFALVPGAIILIGLAIVVGFGRLTSVAADPEHLVDTIESRAGNVRWRAAVSLAGLLADPDHAELRRDRQLAARLTEILRRELESGGTRQEDATLKVFLCRALGEFQSDVSLPVLVQAAGSQHNRQVRRSAIEAIALLADALGPQRVGGEPDLGASLLTASRDGDSQIRLSAAYALGVLGGSHSEQRLVAMLLDENALVRYNAATGLARWGKAAAVDVLLEMLSPDQRSALEDGSDGSATRSQTEVIHVNALKSLAQVANANSEMPHQEIERAVARLAKATESPAVQAEIGKLQQLIQPRRSAPETTENDRKSAQ